MVGRTAVLSSLVVFLHDLRLLFIFLSPGDPSVRWGLVVYALPGCIRLAVVRVCFGLAFGTEHKRIIVFSFLFPPPPCLRSVARFLMVRDDGFHLLTFLPCLAHRFLCLQYLCVCWLDSSPCRTSSECWLMVYCVGLSVGLIVKRIGG